MNFIEAASLLDGPLYRGDPDSSPDGQMYAANRERQGLTMQYSKEEIRQYVAEEDIKFIRLAFCDLSGRQKNISIHPDELDRALQYGIAFDASDYLDIA